MADAVIDIVGPEELPVIVRLYNQLFRPARNEESFQRRYLGRHNVLQMVAETEDLLCLVLRRPARPPPARDRVAAHGSRTQLGAAQRLRRHPF